MCERTGGGYIGDSGTEPGIRAAVGQVPGQGVDPSVGSGRFRAGSACGSVGGSGDGPGDGSGRFRDDPGREPGLFRAAPSPSVRGAGQLSVGNGPQSHQDAL